VVSKTRRNFSGEVVFCKVEKLYRTGGNKRNRTGELVIGKVEVKKKLTRRKSSGNVAEVLVCREVKILKRRTFTERRNRNTEIICRKV
jgi:hypothetical protein